MKVKSFFATRFWRTVLNYVLVARMLHLFSIKPHDSVPQSDIQIIKGSYTSLMDFQNSDHKPVVAECIVTVSWKFESNFLEVFIFYILTLTQNILKLYEDRVLLKWSYFIFYNLFCHASYHGMIILAWLTLKYLVHGLPNQKVNSK